MAMRAIRELSRLLTPLWVALLCVSLVAQPLRSQSASTGNPEPGQSAPTRLQIKILSPAPLSEPAGALSANQVRVQVLDGWGMPVPGATLSFRLPEAGPGGVFLNGLSTEVVIADRQGMATVQGFDWRAEAGTSFLHVIAAYGEIRAGAMVEVQLGRKVRDVPPAATVRQGTDPGELRSAPVAAPSAFPLPAESRTSQQPPPVAAVEPGRKPSSARAVLGQSASEVSPELPAQAMVRRPVTPAPRELPPPAPPADYQAPNVVPSDSGSYVTVKRKPGGAGKMLLILVVAAAAAGGAVAAGVVSGGSSSTSSGNGGSSGPPVIGIGSPSITVTGGGN
ncbi:MAG: hypothetical protein U5J83_13315 [Bryobacterales bacterium]|nr:hypothetical protein [Bryobacterales bacterium]